MDRAEVIKALEEWIEELDKISGSHTWQYRKKVLAETIAALREQERSKWISVKERLPEDERSVLAYYGFGRNGTPDSDMMFTGVLSYFCFDPEPHWQHAGHGLVVTHWMPLPEPPAVQPSEERPSGNVNRKEGADHE